MSPALSNTELFSKKYELISNPKLYDFFYKFMAENFHNLHLTKLLSTYYELSFHEIRTSLKNEAQLIFSPILRIKNSTTALLILKTLSILHHPVSFDTLCEILMPSLKEKKDNTKEIIENLLPELHQFLKFTNDGVNNLIGLANGYIHKAIKSLKIGKIESIAKKLIYSYFSEIKTVDNTCEKRLLYIRNGIFFLNDDFSTLIKFIASPEKTSFLFKILPKYMAIDTMLYSKFSNLKITTYFFSIYLELISKYKSLPDIRDFSYLFGLYTEL